MTEATGRVLVCPRCGGTDFREIDCGPDGYEDDIVYSSDICTSCGLYHSGWSLLWLIDCDNWQDEDGATEFRDETRDE